jgi:heme exporter protein A
LTAGDRPAIQVRGLSKKFGDRVAVRALDLDVAQGEFVALFGPNGSGKTTLIRMLAATLRPTSGTFRIAGLDPHRADRETRRKIGALFHQTFLYDELSARENLVFFAGLYGVPDAASRAEALLDSMALLERADDAVGGYSRGMQQRVALARCLISEPEVVFLDEPFTGLDPHSAARLTLALAELRSRGRTVVLVTHDLRRGLELCDRFVILRHGRIVDQGSSDGLDAATFEARYLNGVGAPAGGATPR